MVELDREIRSWLENEVDSVIRDPHKHEESIRLILSAQGIEPNLETVLSIVAGIIIGYVQALHFLKFKRSLNKEEIEELLKLLKRRAWEMRQAFLGVRINQ